MEAKRSTTVVACGLGVSLMLNAGLGAWLLWAPGSGPRPGPAVLPPSGTTYLDAAAGPLAYAAAPAAAPAPGAALPTPPFHWSQIESDDYWQYIANLRAVGCPEETIRELISADLGALYAPRARAIWSPPKREYWQKDEGGPTPQQVRQLMALAKEEAAVGHELLGAWVNPQDRIDALFLQLHGSEEQLLFLSEEKRAAASAVLREAGVEFREEELQTQGRYSGEEERGLFNEKLKQLARVLSPEELEEFRLRQSPDAQWLRTELQYFDCTPEEFQRLLEAREQSGEHGPQRDLLNREAATAQVRELFGDVRADEFERVTDMHYQQARRAADEFGLAADLADQAWEISRDARQAARRTASNAALPVEERKRQMRAVQEDADRRLKEVLGEKAARAVRRDLKVVLRAAEVGIKP